MGLKVGWLLVSHFLYFCSIFVPAFLLDRTCLKAFIILSKYNPLGKIKDSGRLIITPHLAWASIEARNRCVSETCQNIEAFLKGEDRNIVNP